MTDEDDRIGTQGDVARARSWKVRLALIVLAVVLAGCAAWLAAGVWQRYNATMGPEGAVRRMLAAYASYDAEGLLDATTHDSVARGDEAAFIAQFEQEKLRSDGKPMVRKTTISNVTPDSTDRALVEVEAEWLTDVEKGEYTKRNEMVPVVRRNGVWLVYMF